MAMGAIRRFARWYVRYVVCPKQKGKNIRAIITPLWNDNGVLVNFDNIRVFASQAYNSAWVQFPSEMQAQAVIVVVVVAHIGEHKHAQATVDSVAEKGRSA